ncbi:unnamed protein product, partial [Prorocentrum cordatum]
QGDISAVSVVRYSDVVPRTDQEEMSHSVCFAFCRGVPDMAFFGIKNGRDCYCAPFYKEMAGDSSICDAVCPGEPSLLCGGKSKSSIFSMHSCATTGKELTTAAGKAASLASALGELSGKVAAAGDVMEAMGAKLKASFSETGDAAAAELMQSAKVFAGELLAAAAAGDKLKDYFFCCHQRRRLPWPRGCSRFLSTRRTSTCRPAVAAPRSRSRCSAATR